MKIEVSFSAPVQDSHQETTPSTILGFRSNHHQGFLPLEEPEDQVKLEQETISDVVEFFQGLFGCLLKSTVFVDGGKLSMAGLLYLWSLGLILVGTTRVTLETDHDPASNLPYQLTDGGKFDTDLVRGPETSSHQDDNIFIKFSTKFTHPPSVIVALSRLEIDRDNGANMRIHAFVEDLYEDLFRLHSRTWYGTILYRAGYNWLSVSPDHPLFQAGSFYIDYKDRKDDQYKIVSTNITFKHPYKTPPKVVLWLNALDFCRSCSERVVANATNITKSGFTLQLIPSGDAKLWGAGAAWFAHPADTPGISSGFVSLNDTLTGVVRFDKKFHIPPRRVMVGSRWIKMAGVGSKWSMRRYQNLEWGFALRHG